jgi:hypothetical protein
MNRWVADTFGPSLLPAAGFEKIPAILKPVQSEWGVGCELLLDPADRTRIESMATGDFFWQEFIQGTQEYALHFLAIQGSILFSWLVKYVFETCLPIKSKRYPPVAIMSEPPAPVPGELARMISKLSYSGTGCVNFKYTAQGDLKFLELNPRFGGSLLSNFRGYCEAYIAAVSSLAGVHLKFSSVTPSP